MQRKWVSDGLACIVSLGHSFSLTETRTINQEDKSKLAKKKRKFGRWQVVSEHDGGGQAYIYRVVDTRNVHHGEWALKKLKNAKRHERFSREILALRKLQGHPNIITLIDADDSDEPSWFVMALGQGSLEQCAPEGGYSIETVFRLFRQICNGVAALHEANVVHRDLKPDNIIMAESNAKVGDLGLCLISEMERITPDWEAVGPRYFMAPEAEAGRDEDADVSMDIYSLGKLFYWLLTGTILPREKLHDRKYALPGKREYQALDEFNNVIENAIQEHKRDRTQSVPELLDGLENAIVRFAARPERSLALKRDSKGARAGFDELHPLTIEEQAEFARQVLDGEITAPNEDIWPIARVISDHKSELALSLIATLDESTLNVLIPEIANFYFDNADRTQSLSWASLGWKTKDVRPRIIRHVVAGNNKNQILNAVTKLGFLNLKEHLDLENSLKKLGPPQAWSKDVIVAISMQDYPSRKDDVRAILDGAGTDIERFMFALPILVASENLTTEGMVNVLSEYKERNKNLPGFQERWEEHSKSLDSEEDDESANL